VACMINKKDLLIKILIYLRRIGEP